MTFSLDTRNTKYLHNYEAALRHYDNITPIRNSNCRPIAERRKQHFNIRKDERAGTLIVRLHMTDIITYHQDNRITLDMGIWFSNSTRAAIHAVAGVTLTPKHNQTWVRDHDGKHYPFENNLQLQTGDYYRNHKIINPTHPIIHKLNKKELSRIKKPYEPFIKHMCGTVKLIGEDGFDPQPNIAWNKYAGAGCDPLATALGTHEGMHDLTMWMAHRVGKSRTVYRNYVDQRQPYKVRLADMKHLFMQLLIAAHRDEVLIKTTVTDGSIVRDRYAHMMED